MFKLLKLMNHFICAARRHHIRVCTNTRQKNGDFPRTRRIRPQSEQNESVLTTPGKFHLFLYLFVLTFSSKSDLVIRISSAYPTSLSRFIPLPSLSTALKMNKHASSDTVNRYWSSKDMRIWKTKHISSKHHEKTWGRKICFNWMLRRYRLLSSLWKELKTLVQSVIIVVTMVIAQLKEKMPYTKRITLLTSFIRLFLCRSRSQLSFFPILKLEFHNIFFSCNSKS